MGFCLARLAGSGPGVPVREPRTGIGGQDRVGHNNFSLSLLFIFLYFLHIFKTYFCERERERGRERRGPEDLKQALC